MQPVAVEGIAPQPPTYGLIAALSTNVRDDPSLMVGIRWSPEQCGESGRDTIDCLGSTAGRTPPDNPGIESSDPFVVWAAYECSPFGWESIDYVGRAQRQLAATQSFQIADELWGGGSIVNGGHLTDITSDRVTSTAATPVAALACLEQGLAQCGQGQRGLIHVTPQVLVHLVAAFAVQRIGGQFVSPLGNIVVADAGYDGSGPGGVPAGSSQYAYATDLIGVRLGTVQTVPANLDQPGVAEAFATTFDNTLTVWAQRPALYQWDRCCHLAAEIDLPVCAIGGAS